MIIRLVTVHCDTRSQWFWFQRSSGLLLYRRRQVRITRAWENYLHVHSQVCVESVKPGRLLDFEVVTSQELIDMNKFPKPYPDYTRPPSFNHSCPKLASSNHLMKKFRGYSIRINLHVRCFIDENGQLSMNYSTLGGLRLHNSAKVQGLRKWCVIHSLTYLHIREHQSLP